MLLINTGKEKIPALPWSIPVVLRLAEQYLIRAEARAHTGDLPGAREDINVIRRPGRVA